MNSNVNVFSAIIIGLFTSGGFYTLVLFFMNWRGRRTETARIKAAQEKDEADAKKAEQDARSAETARLKMIADMEQAAHDTAAKVAKQQYEVLERECNKCTNKLAEVQTELQQRDQAHRDELARVERAHREQLAKRDRTQDALLDAITEVIPLLQSDAEHTVAVRAAVRTARQARYDYDSELP